ncbi:SDR family oxidoreductase [Streptomyces sp. Li-HN-5-11]|uniref:SDR family oxidoreductase n=1 Tax=Streptomyces sp. Li-HN-5-11 TaxID=3075432 RepID=UPI0028B17809|nr:SDR family oxidoreductase [Streptomyces sp. Li-HN-5-11]WNM31941.1 SDR family oxidoreductase [Streptomyces sp. Li-HN-5-11]
MTSVNGKVALITGGASGVGAAVARRLHDKGAKVVIADVDGPRLAAIGAELGPRAVTVQADVRNLAAMKAAVAEGVGAFGGIDIVVANAGVGSYGSVEHVDPQAWRTVIDINVVGVFHTVRAALPSVLERRGYILLVSPLGAYIGIPTFSAYHPSKVAVEHFGDVLRLEVGHRGVAVGSAHMTTVDTPMMRDSVADLGRPEDVIRLPKFSTKAVSADEVADAFVKGIENRKRRINCPQWVGLTRWLKPVFTTSWGDRTMRRIAPRLVEFTDSRMSALGRSTSLRAEQLKSH